MTSDLATGQQHVWTALHSTPLTRELSFLLQLQQAVISDEHTLPIDKRTHRSDPQLSTWAGRPYSVFLGFEKPFPRSTEPQPGRCIMGRVVQWRRDPIDHFFEC